MGAIEQSIKNDIRYLEQGIMRLKRQYDMFFAGALDQEPVELRRELESIVRRHSQGTIHKYALRFQFNAAVSRFNTYSELWGKRTRAYEEGDQRTAKIERAVREQLVARCRLSDATAQEQELRRLHREYVETSRKLSPSGKAVSYEKFANGIARQTERLRRESGCDQIEVRLTVRDDKLQLKARPGR